MQTIKPDKTDRAYFTIIQRYVWAQCATPYQFTLWGVIKDIAGEGGECTLSTPDLALLAMMSAGMVSQSREYLLEKELLTGELRRDPGYPQPVWHLAIPDLWKRNVEWSLQYPTLAERIAFKKEQAELYKAETRKKEPSSHESSLEPSSHEGKPSPHESLRGKEPSPHETKKIVKSKKQKEKPMGEPVVLSPGMVKNQIRKYAEDKFLKITNLQKKGNEGELGRRWYTPLRSICELCDWDQALIAEVIAGAIKAMEERKLDIVAPQSILGYCNMYLAKRRGKAPHGANGASLQPPATLTEDLLRIWTTVPLDMQKYIVQNPSKINNFKQALINKGLY